MANERHNPGEPNGRALAPDPNGSDAQAAAEPGAASLVSGIIADARHLIEQQLAMFRQEIHDELHKLKQAAIAVGAGVGIAVVGGALLLVMLPLLLQYLVPSLPQWACFGIVGGVLAALGAALVYLGVRRIRSCNPLSNEAVEALKENFTWTTHPK